MAPAHSRRPASDQRVPFTFRHLPELDGWRGLAIIFVVAGHVLDNEFGTGASLGFLGVLLFFILSGFLITGLLDRELIQTRHLDLRSFYARRALRLFPALFCYLAVLCVMVPTHLVTDTPWYSIAASLLYVRNIWGQGAATGHIWSLSLEEQFYTIWPWVIAWFGSFSALWVAAIGTGAVAFFRMACIRYGWLSRGFAGAYTYRPWFRFDSILIGCALALWLRYGTQRGVLGDCLSSKAVPLLGWPTLIIWTLFGQSLSPVWYLTIETLLAALLFLNLLTSDHLFARSILSHPLLRWIGRISYSWYMWQQLFTQYSSPDWGGLRRFPFNVAVGLLLAQFSFSIVERPFLKLKDTFRQRTAI